MNKVERMKHLFKRYWITIWLAVVALAFCTVITYAKFANGQNYKKQVVEANYSDKVLFSSNYLKVNDPKYPNTVPEGYSGERFFDVSIYNFDRTNATSFYPSTIRYSLTARLKKNKGEDNYQADSDMAALNRIFGDDANNVIKIYRLENGAISGEPITTPLGKTTVSASSSAENLTPGQGTASAINTYRIVMPACVIDQDVYVEISAEPASGYLELPTHIGGMFYVKSNMINLTTSWVGAFNDDQSLAPSAYDGFNYALTGSGAATKVLSWDKSLLEPNRLEILEYFGIDIMDASNYTDNGNMRSITIELSSADNGGRYSLQFYVSGDADTASAREQLDTIQWTGVNGLETKVKLTDPE